jgi:hypothetical protein
MSWCDLAGRPVSITMGNDVRVSTDGSVQFGRA